MKEQDIIKALGNLPQDMLDELTEWQQSGVPLTDALPELDSDSPARTEKPVIVQRRNRAMKQKQKKSAAPLRLLPWTAGMTAAIAACAFVAASVGKEAISRQQNAGYTENQYGSNPTFGYILKDCIIVENNGNGR